MANSENLSHWLLPIGCGLLSCGLFIGVWEIVGRDSANAITQVLPPPSQFLPVLLESDFKVGLGAQSATIYQSVAVTLIRVSVGMAIAFVGSILCGLLISLSKWSELFILPLLGLIAPIAPIAWVPLALVVFGVSNLTAIFIVFMGVFFTLTIATVAEIKRVPENLLMTAQNLGGSSFNRWRWVIVPAVLPGVFTLLRLNFIAAWMAVLAAEMTGLRDGLGTVVMTGRNLFNSDLILLGICIIGITGFTVDRLLLMIQRRFFWWQV
ncbi:ABC transporter permease [cf. Phormidesmis sp. LEGE 11477]|uniref:ABC transporter permease n=1 Tax=cf. Phormidesmis sp. LEGE 11477 TaxID=1828680 RepID=UPI00187FB460|nr:ABC transporter permease subunit [cf. Phormidesmis sp. LEGE 11477]MBE9061380.1 ABC transporter permease subunit [cf. Phormidesmis sp. LEGE 11477]